MARPKQPYKPRVKMNEVLLPEDTARKVRAVTAIQGVKMWEYLDALIRQQVERDFRNIHNVGVAVQSRVQDEEDEEDEDEQDEDDE